MIQAVCFLINLCIERGLGVTMALEFRNARYTTSFHIVCNNV